ncbi:MAG: DUF4136 domain-containing protein [Wenzhouxiangellaceae bacterium]|nr:DUF4136 domain-containing protein [Wenzhouxiangellaceae bacterium]
MLTGRLFKVALLIAAGLALGGCATSPDVRTDYNPETDFTEYETFSWVSELGTDRAGYSTLTTKHFKDAVRREMEALGYTYTERNPDLLVNFFASIHERTETYTRPHPTFGAGYYGYRYGLYTAWPYYGYGFGPNYRVDTVHYKVGTANIDLIDAERRELVWEGIAEGRLTPKELEQPGQAIADTVHDIFEEFPTRQDDGSNG